MTTQHPSQTPPTLDPLQPILQVQDLSVVYGGERTVQAVDQVSFSLPRGARLGIIGESGSGKSTIVNSLLSLLPGNSRIAGGSIRFEELDLRALESEAQWNAVRGSRIAIIPQDPTIALDPVMTVGKQVVETLTIHGGLTSQQARPRAVELLEDVGIREAQQVFRSYPHELSGGMRQRVLIAIALAGDTSLIIADEPTSGLDVTVQKLVLDLLDEVVRSHGVSLILITHDLAVARARCDEILVLEHGRIIEGGRTSEVLASPRSDYTHTMLEAAPSIHDRKLTPSSSVRPPVEGSDIPVAPENAVAPVDPASQEVLLEVSGLAKEFPRKGLAAGRFRAVDDVSFTLRRHRTLGIVGESGSGKSTIARLVTGIVKPDAGTVQFDGADVTRRRGALRRHLFRQIQYVFQNPYASLDPRLTVGASVAEPLVALDRVGGAERDARVTEALDAVGLPGNSVDRLPAELSGGQRQRVAIARALALRPPLLVLDEPVSALDVTVQAQVLQLLVDLQAEFGLSYLFITHDLAVVRQVCDDVLVLSQGRAVEQNTVTDLFAAPEDPYTRELLSAIP